MLSLYQFTCKYSEILSLIHLSGADECSNSAIQIERIDIYENLAVIAVDVSLGWVCLTLTPY